MYKFLVFSNGRHTFKEDLKQLIQQERNAELKHMLRSADMSNLTDSDGLTLLHISASYGNQELTKFLIDQGHCVDAKTSSGCTPLSKAIAHHRYEVAELLLQANAEVYSENYPSESALQMVVNHSMSVPPHVFKWFYDSLKSSYTTNEIWITLLAMECPLDGIVSMQNTVLTKNILSSRGVIEEAESVASIRVAMELVDVPNLRVLMNNGVDSLQRTYAFFTQLADLTTSPTRKDLRVVRAFADYISDWTTWNLHPVYCITRIFEKADESVLRIFLEYEIHLRIKSQTGIDVFAHCYANRSSGVSNLIKQYLIKCYDIGLGIDEKCDLHYAVRECAVENVKVYLSVCLMPNVLDKKGRPALFELFGSTQNIIGKEECMYQLLSCGANVQIVDNCGITVFDLYYSNDDWYLLKLVLAHLAMHVSKRCPLDDTIRYKLFQNKQYLNYYKVCHEQLRDMKRHWVCESLNVYMCVTEPIEILSGYLMNGALKNLMIHLPYVAKFNRYYVFLFKELIDEIELLQHRKSKAADVIKECFEKIRFHKMIVNKIVNYFSYDDLCIFV